MSTNRDFDRIASGWLAEGPTELNDRVLDAALDEVHLTHQRRRPAVLWRNTTMTMPIRLAAAVAIVAVLGFAGLTYLGRLGPNSGGPTPTCTSAPAPSAAPLPAATPYDRGTWKTYVSPRYGLSICYPADWIAVPGDHDWTILDDGNFANTAWDKFHDANSQIFLSAWSVAVDPGTTLDAYVQATCARYQTTCPGVVAGATTVSIDGHPGIVVQIGTSADGFVQAFLLVDNRMYEVASGRAPGDNDSDRLVRTFFSTMHLLPGGPVPVATAAPS